MPQEASRGTRETPRDLQEAPKGPLQANRKIFFNFAAEWRRYHSRSLQHSDVSEAPKK